MSSSRLRYIFAVLFLVSTIIVGFYLLPRHVSAAPGPDWEAGYSYRKKIAIDPTKVSGTADLSNFPVLISVTDNDLRTTGNGGHVQNSNGYDIMFTTSDSTTNLDHEIEKYTATNGEYIAWVRIPTLSYTTDTVIYMYYGNGSISSDPSTTSTWDANFKGVWHLPDGTTLTANDSTINANNGTNNGATATTGQVDGGASFDGNNDLVNYGNVQNIMGTNKTYEFWAKANAYKLNPIIFKNPESSSWDGITIEYSDAASKRVLVYVKGSSSTSSGGYISNYYTTGVWIHTAVLLKSDNTVEIYKDGVKQKLSGGGTYNTPTENNQNLLFGKRIHCITAYFNGIIDEVRISNTARSAGWIQTEYNNQSSPSTFYTVGVEQVQAQVENWKSYNTDTYIPSNEDNTFSGAENTVYMHGSSFNATTQYGVAFYDAEGARTADAHKIQSQDIWTDVSGNLSANCIFTSYQSTADARTWHAVVSSTSYTPPDTYNAGWQYALADHSFTVEESAIPEFPTVVSAVGVTVLCFGIYYWLRKRRAAYVKA